MSWLSLLRKVWPQVGRHAATRFVPKPCRLGSGCEELEPRILLSAVIFSGGVLQITAADGGSSDSVTQGTQPLTLSQIFVNGMAVQDQVNPLVFATVFTTSQIVYQGGSGSDSLFIGLRDPVAVGAHGQGGSDFFSTVGDHDWTVNDSAVAGGSFNYLTTSFEQIAVTGGGFGNNMNASGYSGVAHLFGEGGNDTLVGGSGHDWLVGGGGDDNLTGNAGNDTLEGGDNNDTLSGNAGEDSLSGGSGNDMLDGGTENDVLLGGTGDDKLFGGPGNDNMNGNDDKDELHGQEDHDTLQGGDGDDKLWGDAGNDALYGDDVVLGGTGNDELWGGDNDDQLSGMQGTDTVRGEGGADFFTDGDDGNDTLDPGTGSLFDALSFHSNDAQMFIVSSSYTKLIDSIDLIPEGEDELNSLEPGFDQIFVIGNNLDNVLVIEGNVPQVTFDPGLGSFETLRFNNDSPIIRLIGSLDKYTITTFTAALVPIGQVKWSGRGVQKLELEGGASPNQFQLDQWSGNALKLTGGGGHDITFMARDANLLLTPGMLDIFEAAKQFQVNHSQIEEFSLTGGGGANTIDSAQFPGLVTLDGQGGNDILLGGAGHHAIGGTGFDVLRVGGAGVHLDLTALPDSQIQGFEAVDVTGVGNNILTLNLQEVLNLSTESNTVSVLRDSGDVVNLGTGWTNTGSVFDATLNATFDVYTQAAAVLRVQQAQMPPFVVSGNLATATGTTANDSFVFDLGGRRVIINSVAYAVPTGVNKVQINGLGGTDSLTLLGTAGMEVVRLLPGQAFLDSSAVGITGSAMNMETITYVGNGGADSATLTGSSGVDKFVGRSTLAFLSGTGFKNTVQGEATVVANSPTGGSDTAFLFDTAAANAFTATGTAAAISGTGVSTNNFETVVAYASGGTDTASLTGGTLKDTLLARAAITTFTGAGIVRGAVGFEQLTADGAGGSDVARLFGRAGTDTFTAGPTSAKLNGTGYQYTAHGFETVIAKAAGPGDVATLQDSTGNDQFLGQEITGTLTTSTNSFSAEGFSKITLRGTNGGTNRRTLHTPPALGFTLVAEGTWV